MRAAIAADLAAMTLRATKGRALDTLKIIVTILFEFASNHYDLVECR
jgi:hypothetical protein